MATKTNTDSSVQIAVIDSGVAAHSKLPENNLGIHFFKDEKGDISTNFDINDVLGHGTAINGIIRKVVPDIQIYNIRIFEDFFYIDCEELLAKALDYVICQLNCKIVNISSGVCSCIDPATMERKLRQLYDAGIIVVAAYHNVGCMSLPACSKYVIGVDTDPQIRNNSEYIYLDGSLVNIKANGNLQRVLWKNNSYIADSGTSFATAHVSAIIAQMLQDNPSINSKNIHFFLKERAIKIEHITCSQPYAKPAFSVNNSVIYPFNKEVHALVRFQNMLSFKIEQIFSNKFMNFQQIKGLDAIGVENIEKIKEYTFDTLILSHVRELAQIIGHLQIEKVIDYCINSKKNIYAFDSDMLPYYLKQGGDPAKFFYPHITEYNVPLETDGKLYGISRPVLGIFGTDASQGKFTLQLELRKRFLGKGYNVAQLGTEPNSFLFDFQCIYPMGYNGGVQVRGPKAIATLNNFMHQMDMLNPDIIIVGSQSGTAPEASYHLDYLNLTQYDFLLGTNPDAVVLCVSGYQTPDFILKNVQFIQSATNSSVIGLVLFPLMRKMETISNLRRFRPMEETEKKKICAELSSKTKLPCYDLSSENDLDNLFEQITDFFS